MAKRGTVNSWIVFRMGRICRGHFKHIMAWLTQSALVGFWRERRREQLPCRVRVMAQSAPVRSLRTLACRSDRESRALRALPLGIPWKRQTKLSLHRPIRKSNP